MSEQINEQALRWHTALQAADADWDAFTQWLEADPAHREAYDQVALVDDLVGRHRAGLASVPFESATTRSRGRWRLAAVAAGALVLALSWNYLPFTEPAAVTYMADAGATREVQLQDGSRIALAAASTLTVSGREQQHLSLKGSAYFDVPHDPARRLVIDSGDFQIRDIGTRFEVATAPGGIRVAVAEGEVSVTMRNSAQALPVAAGQQLLFSGSPAVAEYVAVATEDVGSWRSGRLVFHNAPLSQVVAEISRQAGVDVVVDPQVADRRFSGVLTIGDGTALVGRLEEIMGIRLVAGSDK